MSESVVSSVCPVCLRPLPARLVEDGCGDIFLERSCPDHGMFSELAWEGFVDLDGWRRQSGGAYDAASPGDVGKRPDCPRGCRACAGHLVRPCCVLLEVTQRCNLGCPVCFAQSGETAPADPSLAEIASWYDAILARAGHANIQFSGGEPTVRDDLPQIIACGREKGFSYFQVNTNGLRIASEPGYARALKDAGTSSVFLQFDGVSDDVCRILRGRPLLAEKRRAIEACAEAGLPVVLVPTVAAGVNDDQLGDIVRFAVRHSPTVRGVHIQPLARFGRARGVPDGRITIPGVLAALDHQTSGMVALDHFRGGSVESPLCSFSASYRIDGKGRLVNIPSARPSCCGPVAEDAAGPGRGIGTGMSTGIGEEAGKEADARAESRAEHGVGDGIDRARAANALRWGTDLDSLSKPAEEGSLDAFLQDSRRSAFSITGMAFMDADTLDLGRLRRCYIFIMDRSGGGLVPFCAYNLTSRSGRSLYRG